MNKAGNENRSVRNTKRRLRDGLLQLMESRPINEISVKELTELVDVNRGTFYFHYADIYELLHAIEDEFFTQFDSTLNQTPSLEAGEDHPYLTSIFGCLAENRDLCRIMLGPNGDMQFVERVKRLVDERCSYLWRALIPEGDSRRFKLYNAFVINGCVGLIQQLVEEGSPYTPADIAGLTATIVLESVRPCMAF